MKIEIRHSMEFSTPPSSSDLRNVRNNESIAHIAVIAKSSLFSSSLSQNNIIMRRECISEYHFPFVERHKAIFYHYLIAKEEDFTRRRGTSTHWVPGMTRIWPLSIHLSTFAPAFATFCPRAPFLLLLRPRKGAKN